MINKNSLGNVSLSRSSPSTLTLSFTPLHTSHGGSYVCRSTIVDTEAGILLINNDTLSLIVESKFRL